MRAISPAPKGNAEASRFPGCRNRIGGADTGLLFAKLLRRLVCARLGLLLAVAMPAALAPAQVDIVVESRAEGKNHAGYKEIEGKWIDSHNPPSSSKSSASGTTPQKQCGSRKVIFQPDGQAALNPTDAAARFSPRLKFPARCYVYVTWPTGANAAPVHYIIKYANGEDRKFLAQNGKGSIHPGNSNLWILLGMYEFAAGDDQYVEVRIGQDSQPATPGHPAQVFADAVRFTSEPLIDSATLPETKPGGLQGGSGTLPGAAAGNIELRWYQEVEAAMAAAQRENKKILVFFYIPGSTVSGFYDNQLFRNDQVKAELNRAYITVRIDYAANPGLAEKLGVFRGGTIILYTNQGTAIERLTDPIEPADFIRKLKK